MYVEGAGIPASASLGCSRRDMLRLAGASTIRGTSAAGCLGLNFGDEDDPNPDVDLAPWGVEVDETAVAWSDLGELTGELTVYSGRTRDQIDGLFAALEETYPDLTIHRDYDDNASQLNKLREEGMRV